MNFNVGRGKAINIQCNGKDVPEKKSKKFQKAVGQWGAFALSHWSALAHRFPELMDANYQWSALAFFLFSLERTCSLFSRALGCWLSVERTFILQKKLWKRWEIRRWRRWWLTIWTMKRPEKRLNSRRDSRKTRPRHAHAWRISDSLYVFSLFQKIIIFKIKKKNLIESLNCDLWSSNIKFKTNNLIFPKIKKLIYFVIFDPILEVNFNFFYCF